MVAYGKLYRRRETRLEQYVTRATPTSNEAYLIVVVDVATAAAADDDDDSFDVVELSGRGRTAAPSLHPSICPSKAANIKNEFDSNRRIHNRVWLALGCCHRTQRNRLLENNLISLPWVSIAISISSIKDGSVLSEPATRATLNPRQDGILRLHPQNSGRFRLNGHNRLRTVDILLLPMIEIFGSSRFLELKLDR